MNGKRAREVAIRIVDQFEELLAEKGIMIPSADREGGEEEACLYGTEYYLLEDAITEILVEETRRARKGSRNTLGAECVVGKPASDSCVKSTCALRQIALC